MPTTKSDIKAWLEVGKLTGCSHVLIATDWFSYDDYPIFIRQGDNPKDATPEEDRIMECYKLDLDWDMQLSEGRALHWELK